MVMKHLSGFLAPNYTFLWRLWYLEELCEIADKNHDLIAGYGVHKIYNDFDKCILNERLFINVFCSVRKPSILNNDCANSFEIRLLLHAINPNGSKK